MMLSRSFFRSLQTRASIRHGSALNAARAFSKLTSPSSRKGSKGQQAALETPDSKAPEFDFDEEAARIIRKIYDQALPMEKTNPGFEVSYDPDEPSLVIFTAKGKLAFSKDTTRPVLIYQSFNSGSHNYMFNTDEGLWLSDQDEHDIRGIVTRDLIKHNIGMPNLD
jgi:hypothetical protein